MTGKEQQQAEKNLDENDAKLIIEDDGIVKVLGIAGELGSNLRGGDPAGEEPPAV